MFGLYYAVFRLVVLNSFEDLEFESARRSALLCRTSLDYELVQLGKFTHDWSSWDDTYQYVQDRNQEFERDNFVPDVFIDQSLNLISVYDLNGATVWSQVVGADFKTPVSFDLKTAMPNSLFRVLLANAAAGKSRTGILPTPLGPLLLSAYAILTSENDGPSQGMMVMGRVLDGHSIMSLSRRIGFPVKLLGWSESDLTPEQRSGFEQVQLAGEIKIRTPSASSLDIDFVYMGLDGRPALYLEAALPRDIMVKGVRAYRLGLIIIFLLCAMTLMAVSILLREAVVLPLQRLTTAVMNAATDGHLDRLPDENRFYEIDTLARVFRETLAKLQAREETFAAIGAAARDLITMFDEHNHVVYWSDAGRTLLGYTADAALGKNLCDLFEPGADRVLLERRSDEGMSVPRDDIGDGTLELRARHADGHVVHVELSLSSLELHGRRHTVGIIRDITDRLHAEVEKEKLGEQLRQAQKMESIGRLAGGVAHDFNNLLTCILGNTELLMLDMDETDSRHEALAEVHTAADRAASLTAQLLAFSRKQIIDPKVLDLNDLILNASKMLRRLISEDIDLRFEPGSGLAKIKVDANQIEQILINLVINARDAMPKGGRLTIQTANAAVGDDVANSQVDALPGRYVSLCVSDTGSGMSPETLERIFEPFYTTKEVGKGTGLGLSMTYGAIKQNGGFVSVESVLGQGTQFKIFLPALEEGAETAARRDRSTLPTGSETILLVEDESVVRAFVLRVLNRLGYQVITAENGEQALRLAVDPAVRFDLLLTDVVMPNMNGRQLFQTLQQVRSDLRVLYMSGYAADVITRQGVLAEGTKFIQKPFTAEELARLVREGLDV